MVERRTRGGYHEWTAFLRCPDCGRGEITLEHYEEGTMFRCRHCGAEAWAEGISEKE